MMLILEHVLAETAAMRPLFMPPSPKWEGIKQSCGPPVCQSVGLSHARSSNKHGAFKCYGYYKTLIGNPMLHVEPTGQRGHMASEVIATSLRKNKITSSLTPKPTEIEL